MLTCHRATEQSRAVVQVMPISPTCIIDSARSFAPFVDSMATTAGQAKSRRRLARAHARGWWVGCNQCCCPNPRSHPRQNCQSCCVHQSRCSCAQPSCGPARLGSSTGYPIGAAAIQHRWKHSRVDQRRIRRPHRSAGVLRRGNCWHADAAGVGHLHEAKSTRDRYDTLQPTQLSD